MKNRIIKLSLCILGVMWIFHNFNLLFYNVTFQLSYEVVRLCAILALFLSIVWQLTVDGGWVGKLRVLLVSMIGIIFFVCFLGLMGKISLVAAGRTLEDANNLTIVEQRTGPQNTTILIIADSDPWLEGTYAIAVKTPILRNVAYENQILWRQKSLPTESQIQEAIDKFKKQNAAISLRTFFYF